MVTMFGSRPAVNLEVLARVKAWVRGFGGLSDEVSILVTELRCAESGCPPLETVIAVLDQPGQTRQYKIHKAMSDVSSLDVQAAISGKPACEHLAGK